jgi:hypothetical protein
MDAFAAELEACLAEVDREITGDGDVTAIVPALQRRRRHKKVSAWPVLLGLAGLLGIAAIVTGFLTLSGDEGGADTGGVPIAMSGVQAYDPFGSGGEHDSDAPKATDGNLATYWPTEDYRSFQKEGVGLVLDAGDLVDLSSVRVRTDTPGFTAEIRATNTLGATPNPVSESLTVEATTTFAIDEAAPKQYYVVWITKLPSDRGSVHVNEVRAFGS